jgi:putative oxidoreductase
VVLEYHGQALQYPENLKSQSLPRHWPGSGIAEITADSPSSRSAVVLFNVGQPVAPVQTNLGGWMHADTAVPVYEKENKTMNQQRRLAISLLCLRMSVFLVMLMWTLAKFVSPDRTADIFSKFYGISGLEVQMVYVLAGLELVLLFAFLAGIARRWSYGIVLLLHAVSTLSPWRQYSQPFEGTNLMFFAAWPMLAACVALYLLRDSDVYTFGAPRQSD